MGAERERVDGFGRLEDGLLEAGYWYLQSPAAAPGAGAMKRPDRLDRAGHRHDTATPRRGPAPSTTSFATFTRKTGRDFDKRDIRAGARDLSMSEL